MTKTPSASRRKPAAQAIVPAQHEEQALPSRGEFDLHIPLSSRAVFWRPRHLAASVDLDLLPSLFWLVESIRPSRCVQIGLGDGVAYLALCQAIDKLGLDASAAGLEPRPDLPALPPAMAEQHDMGYRDFSMVMAAPATEAARRMAQSAIDLLVINCPLDAELVENLNALWLPRLSARAVIAVLNPHLNAGSPEARALLDPYLSKGNHFAYDHGESSLLLCLAGGAQPERLRRLATLEPSEPGFMAAMQVFRRLGDALAQEWRVIEQGGKTAEIDAELRQTKTKLSETNVALSKARAANTVALEGERMMAAQLATLQARAFDAEEALRQDRASQGTAQAAAEARHKGLEEELAQKLADHNALQQQLAAAAQREADLQTQHELRIADVVALCQNHHAAQTAAEARVQELEQELVAQGVLQQQLAETTQREADLQTQHELRIEDILALCASHKAAQATAEARVKDLEAELGEQNMLRRQLAEVGLREKDLQVQHEMRVEDIVALTSAHGLEIAGLENKLAAMSQTAETHRQAYREAQDIRTRHWKRIEALEGNLADMARLAETHRQAYREAQDIRSRHWKRIEALEAELRLEQNRAGSLTRAMEAQRNAYEQEKRALMSSTSWKITKPLRGIGGTVRRGDKGK